MDTPALWSFIAFTPDTSSSGPRRMRQHSALSLVRSRNLPLDIAISFYNPHRVKDDHRHSDEDSDLITDYEEALKVVLAATAKHCHRWRTVRFICLPDHIPTPLTCLLHLPQLRNLSMNWQSLNTHHLASYTSLFQNAHSLQTRWYCGQTYSMTIYLPPYPWSRNYGGFTCGYTRAINGQRWSSFLSTYQTCTLWTSLPMCQPHLQPLLHFLISRDSV